MFRYFSNRITLSLPTPTRAGYAHFPENKIYKSESRDMDQYHQRVSTGYDIHAHGQESDRLLVVAVNVTPVNHFNCYSS